MAKISTITPLDDSKSNEKVLTDKLPLIYNEEVMAIRQSNTRNDIFRDILHNSKCEKLSLKFLVYGLGTILLPTTPSFFCTLIPWHDAMESQKYWYEQALKFVFCLTPFMAAHAVIKSSLCINVKFIKNVRNFLITWLVFGSLWFISQILLYMVWARVLEYNYPVPLNCYIVGTVLKIALFVRIWYMFPYEMRGCIRFKKRLISLILATIINQCMMLEYAVITKMFMKFSGNHQWVIALILPLIREFNIQIPLFWISKSTAGDKRCAELAHIQGVSSAHSFFLTYTVGSIATMQTAIVILGTDFLMNSINCFKLIHLRQKNSSDIEKQIKLLQDLVISEMIEFVVPLAYMTSFIGAYFGPNSTLIGNIGSSLWQYSAVENVGHVVQYVTAFFVVDLTCLILSSFLLWKFSKIDLHRAYIAIHEEFGLAFIVQMTTILTAVNKSNKFLSPK